MGNPAQELAQSPAVQAAAAGIHAASNPSKPTFNLVEEAKAEARSAKNSGYHNAYEIQPDATTLTKQELGKYNDIVEKFSHSGQGEASKKAFIDALRDLNGESAETRAHVAGALMYHGAKAGRNGSSLTADTLTFVHDAQDLKFKAFTPDKPGASSEMGIKELMSHGSLGNSGGVPKASPEDKAYLETQIAHAHQTAHKFYPKEFSADQGKTHHR